MNDKEWQKFFKWWKSRWSVSEPHRPSIEQYLKWREGGLARDKGNSKKDD